MIAPHELECIRELVVSQGPSEALVSALRQQFPGKHFTYCMDDDINHGRPVVQGKGFNLYLVDSRDHCSCLTTDASTASGVVLAEVIE